MQEMESEAELTIFDNEIKDLEGTEILLTGYYLPFQIEGNRIIISKLPYAACFFCGGDAGLESVAEIQFKINPPKFMLDELVRLKGNLKLNEREYGHLVFILEEASVVFNR